MYSTSPYHIPTVGPGHPGYRGLSGLLTPAQLTAAKVSAAEVRDLPPDVRMDLAIRHLEAEEARKDRVWIFAERLVTVAIPLAIAFGFWKTR